MPEFKQTGPAMKLQNIEPQEGIKTAPEKLETEKKIEAQQDTSPPQDSGEKKMSLIVKRMDNLNNIEKTRKDLGLPDLNKEETDRITQQKLKLQEELTGMKQQTAETDNTQADLESPEVQGKTANVDEVANDILLDPTRKVEVKEAVPFDIKKLYNALDNMLVVFDNRAKKISGFDIIPQESFDKLAHLHHFMTEKIIGDPAGESALMDLTVQSELSDELAYKFRDAFDSLQINPEEAWQGFEYAGDVQNMRDSFGYMTQELAPFAQELQKSEPYKEAGDHLYSLASKTNAFNDLFSEKLRQVQS